MSPVALAGLVLAGVVVLTPLSRRLGLPQPVVLTVLGLALGLVPGTGPVPVDPELILPVVLPPLLFAATQRATVSQFRSGARVIAALAVGLTLVSAAAVAVVVHAMGLGWAESAVLGAVVSPPDPVAATSVARRLHLPGRVLTLIEGEGLFNDATALVLYATAVTALVTGEVSAPGVAGRLVREVVLGVLLGLAAGWLARVLLARIDDSVSETTLTLAAPFAVYLAADRLEGSGVLAVITLGLYLRSRGHAAVSSSGYLLGRSVWRYLDFLVTSVVFVLLGVELSSVLLRAAPATPFVLMTAVVTGVLVVVRVVFLLVALPATHRLTRARLPYDRHEGLAAGWAGMRGVVTVAVALSVPRTGDDGARATIVLVALATVLVTLVVQGLTLPWVVRRLGVAEERDERAEAAALRRRAAEAALDAVRRTATEHGVPDAVHRAAARRYEAELEAQEALAEARADDTRGDDHARAVAHLARVANDVERDVVLAARQSGEVSTEVAEEVLRAVEARSARITG
ncbi:Na+/H+ antiporter [Phycicoccus sp. MAQZ13P-2]|uniref:Na+/H+ antiporter n=1 Tax=Phycicoccus mangrovi TaxID=2840470 RepID=UPI001C006C2E|nr:Na+/H+ antiporter [Phycicoccus mangrovi]MBT9257454.1 Na+/H+ antiporter [Phycicoccus mangrovi]MBT9275671.1 Na+/H+ antiporter [Phycicoccus mangrovi]